MNNEQRLAVATTRVGTTARLRAHWPALAVLLLGAALRLYDLGGESLWFDEVFTVLFAQDSVPSILSYRAPVFVVLGHYWTAQVGMGEAAVRVLPALFGIAAIPVVYLAGLELFNRRIALTAACLMSISEFQIYYAQDFRFYSLFLLLTSLSFLFYIRAYRHGRWPDLLLYALASFLAYHTHSLAVLALVAQGAHFVLFWGRHRHTALRWLGAQALIAVSLAPAVLPDLMGQAASAANNQLAWVPQRSVAYVLRNFYWYVFPLRYDRSWQSLLWSAVAAAGVFALLCAVHIVRGGAAPWLRAVKDLTGQARALLDEREELLLVLAWTLVPSVGLYAISRLFSPIYVDRYTIPAAAGFYLLLAVLVERVRRVIPTAAILGAVAVMVAPGLQHYYVSDVKEQWRQAAQYVQENTRDEDVLFFAPNEGGEALQMFSADDYGWQQKVFYFYYRGNLPTCSQRMDYVTPELIRSGLDACTAEADAMWLIVRGPEEKVATVNDFFFAHPPAGMRVVSERHFVGVSVYAMAIERPG